SKELIKKHSTFGTNISGTIRCISASRRISKCSELKTLSIGTDFVPKKLCASFHGTYAFGHLELDSFIHSFIYKNRYVRVSGRGIRFLDNSLHTVRSVAIAAASSGSKPALRISASLWSFHLVLGLPTGRCP